MANLLEKTTLPLCLAPMVGLSHVALRRLLHDYLPEGAVTIWPTEMLNSRKLPKENLGFTPETLKTVDERFLIPQILGNEENFIAESSKKLEDWGAHGIDINMGCPVQKALRHNYGVALMGDRDYAAKVVEMTVKNTSLPVSVKLRVSDVEQGPEYFSKFVKGLESAGAAWLTLHPRTASQQRRGNADWSQIRWLKENIKIPVIGNGDIQTVEDVFEMRKSTGCDMVMAGRALAARPWMLWQLGEDMKLAPPKGLTGKAPRTRLEEGREYGRALLKMIDYCEESFKHDIALRKIRFYLKTTHVWLDFGHPLLAVSTQVTTISDLKLRVAEFFDREIEMRPTTDLRQ